MCMVETTNLPAGSSSATEPFPNSESPTSVPISELPTTEPASDLPATEPILDLLAKYSTNQLGTTPPMSATVTPITTLSAMKLPKTPEEWVDLMWVRCSLAC